MFPTWEGRPGGVAPRGESGPSGPVTAPAVGHAACECAAANGAAGKAAIACALGHRTLVTPELVAVVGDTGYRVHSVAVPLAPLDPLLLAGWLADFYGDAEFVVHGGLGDLGLGSLGASHLRMLDRLPVLLRPAGVPPVGAAEEVRDRGAVAGWTRTVVAGYPFPEAGIASPGALLDPRVLATPGLRLLVRTEYGRPVAAGFAYDDRRSLGIYWLATLPARPSVWPRSVPPCCPRPPPACRSTSGWASKSWARRPGGWVAPRALSWQHRMTVAPYIHRPTVSPAPSTDHPHCLVGSGSPPPGW